MKLSEKICRNAEQKLKPYKLADGNGLLLQVQPNGKKYWRYYYRYFEKNKTISFGVYPEISLVEAREAHKKAHKLLGQGIDPSQNKKQNKVHQKFEAHNTFQLIAEQWLNKRLNEVKPNTYNDMISRLRKEIYPRIGKMPIKDITAPMLLELLRAVEARGIYETVRRLRQYIGQIFQFAIAMGHITVDPSAPLVKVLRTAKVQHRKAMSLEDLPVFWQKLKTNEANVMKQTRLGLMLIVLTMVRRPELTNAAWAEINFETKTWTIPAERMKMNRPHVVPLSEQSLKIFKELKELSGSLPNVFPGRSNPWKPISSDTLLMALHRFGYKDKATLHGFRALAMTTIMEKFNYRYEVPDLQLAHSKGDSIRAAYDRTQFLDERRKMMQEWADYIEKISAI